MKFQGLFAKTQYFSRPWEPDQTSIYKVFPLKGERVAVYPLNTPHFSFVLRVSHMYLESVCPHPQGISLHTFTLVALPF